jgi:hypothetical protein
MVWVIIAARPAMVIPIAATIMAPIGVGGVGAGKAETQNAGEKKGFSQLHHIEPPKLSAKIWVMRRVEARAGTR